MVVNEKEDAIRDFTRRLESSETQLQKALSEHEKNVQDYERRLSALKKNLTRKESENRALTSQLAETHTFNQARTDEDFAAKLDAKESEMQKRLEGQKASYDEELRKLQHLMMRETLDWQESYDLDSLVREMVTEDLRSISSGQPAHAGQR